MTDGRKKITGKWRRQREKLILCTFTKKALVGLGIVETLDSIGDSNLSPRVVHKLR